jgi:hypothetical protein
MQENHDTFNKELTAIARLLTLQPNQRRAVKITHDLRIYEIEDRATNKLLSFILIQLIRKPITETKSAPIKLADLREVSKLATMAEKPWSVLFYWPEHFGLWLGGDYFAIDDLPTAPNNKNIALIPLSDLRLLYSYNGQEQDKIDPNSIISTH